MTKDQLFSFFSIEDLRDLPDAVTRLIEGDVTIRNKAYKELLELNDNDISYDWFQPLYEAELAERGQKKQDFTPVSLSLLASEITGSKGSIYEPTAGNGSMIISDWWNRCSAVMPWQHFPSQNMVTCWELSARSIPILLLNLSIRGIMGYVYHGDCIEQTIKMKYVLLNRKNSTMSFSEIIKDEKNQFKITQK